MGSPDERKGATTLGRAKRVTAISAVRTAWAIVFVGGLAQGCQFIVGIVRDMLG